MMRACAKLAAGLLLALVASAAAGRADPPAAVEEITVTGERAGPGLWHVHKGAANLWIFGTASPLPKDMTWRSTQLESILDRSDEVLVAKPVDIGVARAVWLMITQRELLMAGKGRKLKDVMPPDLYARFAVQRAKFTNNADKWEKYRPIVAAAFLEEDALHQIGLSTHLDLGEEVRSLARKHHVRVEEFKIAGWHDVLDALKTLPPATENKCVAASLATLETGLPRLVERAEAWATGNIEKIQKLPEPGEVADCRAAMTVSGAGDLLTQLRHSWIDHFERSLSGNGTTLAALSMDMLIQPGGLLDELRARGYTIDPP
jgi:uncharacterized protein YbaP (TraB family)